MSFMDKLKGMIKGHEDQASKGIDKAGDYVDQRTQNKHRSQVDAAQQKMKDELGGQGRQGGQSGQSGRDRDVPPHP